MKRLVAALLAAAVIGTDARAQEVTWLPRPSFQFGDVLRIDPRVRVQGDFRWFPEALAPEDGTFAMGRRRVSVEGTFLRKVDFEIERDLRGNAWGDLYLNVRFSRRVALQAGRFKMPFGLEELISGFGLDFITRSVIARDLAPGREVGAMLHGRVLDERAALAYQAGVFRHDGDRSRFGTNPGAGTTFAARVRAQPLRSMKAGARLRTLEIGVATTAGDVPEGPNSLRARTLAGQAILDRFEVRGRRTRLGVEASWEPGPFSIRAEKMQTWDAREGQGISGDDLPRLTVGGWHAGGSWVVTGEQKAGGVRPTRPLFDGGVGAVELAARYERLDHLVDGGSGATTLGLNWYLNRWLKVQVNGVRESFDRLERSTLPGQTSFWSALGRLQFVL